MRPDGFLAEVIRALARNEEPFAPSPIRSEIGCWNQLRAALARRLTNDTATEQDQVMVRNASKPNSADTAAPPGAHPISSTARVDFRDLRLLLDPIVSSAAVWRLHRRKAIYLLARMVQFVADLDNFYVEVAEKLRRETSLASAEGDREFARHELSDEITNRLFVLRDGADWLRRSESAREDRFKFNVVMGEARKLADPSVDILNQGNALIESISTARDLMVSNVQTAALILLDDAESGRHDFLLHAHVDLAWPATHDLAIVTEQAANDFRGADLRDADLELRMLEGVIWSSATRWPDDQRDAIERSSFPLGGDTFRIAIGYAGAGDPKSSAPP